MDTQDPPTDPAINLLGVYICLDNKKDAMTSCTLRHLVSAQWDRPACEGIMYSYKATFSVVWRAGLPRLD